MPRVFILIEIKVRVAWMKRHYLLHMLQRMMEMSLKSVKGSILMELE